MVLHIAAIATKNIQTKRHYLWTLIRFVRIANKKKIRLITTVKSMAQAYVRSVTIMFELTLLIIVFVLGGLGAVIENICYKIEQSKQ
jgi:hypothetical protein